MPGPPRFATHTVSSAVLTAGYDDHCCVEVSTLLHVRSGLLEVSTHAAEDLTHPTRVVGERTLQIATVGVGELGLQLLQVSRQLTLEEP
jgi:hypothetical protein